MALLLHAFGEGAGGVGTHGSLLARELGRRGHRVSVLALEGESSRAEGSLWREDHGEFELWRMAYRFGDVRGLEDLLASSVLGPAVEAWVRARPLDWVHVHHLTGFGSEVLGRLRRIGVPILLTLHDYWALCPRGQMLRHDLERCASAEPDRCGPCLERTWPHLFGGEGVEGSRGVEERAALRTDRALSELRLADRCLVPSDVVRRRYLEAGIPKERVFVVEPGVDVEGLRAAHRAHRGLGARTDGRAVLGVLGSVIPSKGVLFLARVLRDLPHLDLELRIHGPLQPAYGSRAHLEELASVAAADGRIRIEGSYPASQLGQILAGLDGVAAPALWDEAFGLSVREARAVGLPVLVSDRGGLPGATEGGACGLVLPAGDPLAWGAALGTFAEDQDWRTRCGRGGSGPTTSEQTAIAVEGHGFAILDSRSPGARGPRVPG